MKTTRGRPAVKGPSTRVTLYLENGEIAEVKRQAKGAQPPRSISGQVGWLIMAEAARSAGFTVSSHPGTPASFVHAGKVRTTSLPAMVVETGPTTPALPQARPLVDRESGSPDGAPKNR